MLTIPSAVSIGGRRWAAAYSMLLQLLVTGPQMVLGPLVASQHLGGAPAWAAIGVAQTASAITGGLLALRARTRRPLRTALLAGLAMIPYLLALAVPAPPWADRAGRGDRHPG